MWPFKSKKLKSYLIDGKTKIILAFEQGGKKYYQFENAFDLTKGRGLMAITIYEEFQMRCDRDYLEKHCKAIDILMNKNPIKLTDIMQIHYNLKERLNLAPYPDQIYKLASIMFFDESESPYVYDWQYNQKKIAEWRKDSEMLPFLVKVPLKHSMPFGDIASENLNTYFQVAEAVNRSHQQLMSETLSSLQ